MTGSNFKGFPREAFDLLSQLDLHNEREWMKDHKEVFEQSIMEPTKDFVVAMGEKLKTVAPKIQAIPQTDRSIFRIHRDTRFSKDKRPFKTHVGIFFWEPRGKKLECPGFYLQLNMDTILIGGGMHIFSKEHLTLYRESVDHKTHGPRLQKILETARKSLGDQIAVEPFKRVPKGYAQDHPRAELLKQKGVSVGETIPIPPAMHTAKCVDFVFKRFEKMLPLHHWLLEMLDRA